MGLVNIQNTNFENGVTNRNAADLFGSMAQLDPTRFHTYMEDFDYFTAADWAISGVGAGTQALSDSDGGVLLLTTAGADNDAEFMVKNGEGFLVETSFPIYYRTRFSIQDEIETDFFSGLADAAPLTPANGIFFRKDDDDALLDIVVRSGAAEVAVAVGIATLTDVFFTAEFYWDGIDRVYYGVDGAPLGFLDLNGIAIPAGLLAPVFGNQAGDASANFCLWDYIFVAKHRG